MTGYWARFRIILKRGYAPLNTPDDYWQFVSIIQGFEHTRKNGKTSIRRIYDRYKVQVEAELMKMRLKDG